MTTSHLQFIMTAQDYILSKLAQLQQPTDLQKPTATDELVEFIFKLIASKKFRKYSLAPEYAAHIKQAVRESVMKEQPISFAFLGGCYKLWRLEEAPESDWAELFACMYYSNWLKPICEVYEPGVGFDFFLDDVIIPRIDNITEQEVETYRQSRQRIIDFLKPYQPANMHMTLTGVGEQFAPRANYEAALDENIQMLASELPGGLPQLTDAQKAMTSLNVRTTPEQESDPLWREKVELVHSAYLRTKAATGYTTMSHKIRVFTQPFPNGTCIAVGATKDSIAKFWAGVGALRPRDDEYRQLVLTPKQLQEMGFTWEQVEIKGLTGKNFSKIRVLS